MHASLAVLAVLLPTPVLTSARNIAREISSVPAAAQAGRAEAPLANADVIKLFKLGLGDEIVIAKINQAKAVDFQLDTDDLAKLMEQHVSKSIIAAMLKRATQQADPSSGQLIKKVQEPEYIGVFFLLDPLTGNLIPLERQTPEQNAKIKALGFGGAEVFMDIAGEKSPVRFKEGQKLEFVVLVPSQQTDPQGIIQFCSLESKKGKRRLVAVTAGVFSGAKTQLSENAIVFNAVKYGSSSFKITPMQTLLSGEYAFTGNGTKDGFCFGIDADPSNQASRNHLIVPFQTGVSIPLGFVERLVTIHSVELISWPKPEAIQKAEGTPGDITNLTLRFTYTNPGKQEWKCKYRVAVLDEKGAEIGSGEREASLGGEQKSDTNRISVKMKTLDYPKAAKLRVQVVLARAD